jgi:hypothetical protein
VSVGSGAEGASEARDAVAGGSFADLVADVGLDEVFGEHRAVS